MLEWGRLSRDFFGGCDPERILPVADLEIAEAPGWKPPYWIAEALGSTDYLDVEGREGITLQMFARLRESLGDISRVYCFHDGTYTTMYQFPKEGEPARRSGLFGQNGKPIRRDAGWAEPKTWEPCPDGTQVTLRLYQVGRAEALPESRRGHDGDGPLFVADRKHPAVYLVAGRCETCSMTFWG